MIGIVYKRVQIHPYRFLRLASRVCLLFLSLSFLLFFGSAFAATDKLSLLVNGKSVHMKKSADTNYNESNWGFGLQYEFANTGQKWVPFAAVSGFKDSNNQASYYAGGGYMRRLILVRKWNQLHMDAGLIGFVMSRQDYKDGDPFVGALPALSLGTNDISLNVTYIPKVHPRIAELWFFQLKLSARTLK